MAVPEVGRRYRAERKVRLGDADPGGRLRLDALARYLQDVANDDAREALRDEVSAWVARRTVIDVVSWPRYGEVVELTTFLGGVGPRLAERRTSVRGARGGVVECASIWVHVDVRSGRPAPLPEQFLTIYGEAYGDRKVRGRLVIPNAPVDGAASAPWSFRRTDLDLLAHVNNAAYWAIVEEQLGGAWRDALASAPARYELEHRVAASGDEPVALHHTDDHAWLVRTDTGEAVATARVTRSVPA